MVSALVLGLTGMGWTVFQNLQSGLTTADVTGFNAPDGATDILLVGSDSRTDAQGNPLPPEVLEMLGAADNEGELTDTLILVRIPNNGNKAVAISLPRDLYVEMPQAYGQHKLNSAFARAKNETAQRLVAQGVGPEQVREKSVQAGRRFLVQTVEKLTGVGVDHYAEVNMLGFAKLTEAVGGVKVCLKAPVDDPASGADFPAGVQTISGAEALAFVRQRHGLPRGDLDRVVRQQAFLAGLADKVLSANTLANPSRLRELIEATQQALVLDKNFNVLEFAARMQGLAAGNVKFVTVPVAGDVMTDEGAALEVDREAVQQFVASVLESGSAASSNAAITVDVLNAVGITGLAGRVSDVLGNARFDIGVVGNAEPAATSVVRYAPGYADRGSAVADALGGLPTEEDADLAADTVQVYLGDDYAGPGTQHVSGDPVVNVDSATEPTPPQAPPPTGPTLHAGDVPCVN